MVKSDTTPPRSQIAAEDGYTSGGNLPPH
ncbi:hypothetical protein E2C01_097108 [Portunus trituberculatus]|uniref:Uncharacterized protein n=1 Tax=Portunus trituberculatus TaxID=210409 RepID=A0A5B7K4U3_PORTR|nr:hypothetical protein [Portunus trituberculatus]